MFTNVIHNKESVEALGKDYGVKGADGTGPWCFESWQPRTQIVLKRHDAYKWGPSMYKNKGPVKFEKLVDQDRAGGFEPRGGHDGRPVRHHPPVPGAVHHPGQDRADAAGLPGAKPNFQLLYFGYKMTRPMVADKRVREAMSIAINRAEIAKGILLGNADPAFTIVDQGRPRLHDPKTMGIVKEDVERAKKLLDEAGWKPGADGIREKDGVKLAPKVYFTANANSARVGEAIQGYMRKIGVQWQIQPWDSTIAAAKMAEQDYEIWSVTVPYLSAGDLMNIYFDSKNIPTPNRMNWKDAETDEWLKLGRSALTEADRAKYYALVQQKAIAGAPVDAGAQHQHGRGREQEGQGRAAAHDLPEHLLQGVGHEFLRSTTTHPEDIAQRRISKDGDVGEHRSNAHEVLACVRTSRQARKRPCVTCL